MRLRQRVAEVADEIVRERGTEGGIRKKHRAISRSSQGTDKRQTQKATLNRPTAKQGFDRQRN